MTPSGLREHLPPRGMGSSATIVVAFLYSPAGLFALNRLGPEEKALGRGAGDSGTDKTDFPGRHFGRGAWQVRPPPGNSRRINQKKPAQIPRNSRRNTYPGANWLC